VAVRQRSGPRGLLWRAGRAENAAVRHEVLGGHSPALTIVITGIFDEAWLLEIEAVAAA
jgi:2-iminobutanoate/2-iminopropanoate deaminase